MLFPLKEADAIEQIQKMTTEVNAGQTGTDPVTGRRFRRISFTEKEQEIVWLLENFDYNVMWNKTGQQLAKRTGWQVVAFSLVSACLAVLTGWAMWWLHDPNLALYTTLAVIATSYSLCWLYVCFSGHLDALKLARMDQDEVRSVIKRLRNGYDIQGV